MLHLNAGFDAGSLCQVTGVITENFVGVVHGSIGDEVQTKRFDSKQAPKKWKMLED